MSVVLMQINMHLLSAPGNTQGNSSCTVAVAIRPDRKYRLGWPVLKMAEPGSWLDSIEKVGSEGRWDPRAQGVILKKVGASGAEGSGIDLSLSQHEQSGIMRALLARRECKWTRSPREPRSRSGEVAER